MAVAVFELAIAEVVEHEQAFVQLGMLPDPLDQLFGLPADLADEAQRHVTALVPQPLESIEQIDMVLARLDGTDHQVHRMRPAHPPHFLAHHRPRMSPIELAAQVEMIEPALLGHIAPQAPLHLAAHLIADGLRDGDEAIGSAGDPVEPLLEDANQAFIAELRVGQRNQIVDDRNDAHALPLQALGHRKEVGVPGGVQQHQHIAGLTGHFYRAGLVHIIQGHLCQHFLRHRQAEAEGLAGQA